MKLIKGIFVIVILCIAGGYIMENSKINIKISASDANIVDINETIYTKKEILEIIAFDGTINELDELYPVECIRALEDGYRTAYKGISCVAIIKFDSFGKKLFAQYYDVYLSKIDFDGLKVGDSLELVQNTDPKGTYSFLYTGRNDLPKISTHCTTDGYMINVEYDNNGNVINIRSELI